MRPATSCCRICVGSLTINLITSLAEQLVGIREVDDQVWQVSFLEYDLRYFDRDENRVEHGCVPQLLDHADAGAN